MDADCSNVLLVTNLDGAVLSGNQEEAALRQHGDGGHVRLLFGVAAAAAAAGDEEAAPAEPA